MSEKLGSLPYFPTWGGGGGGGGLAILKKFKNRKASMELNLHFAIGCSFTIMVSALLIRIAISVYIS